MASGPAKKSSTKKVAAKKTTAKKAAALNKPSVAPTPEPTSNVVLTDAASPIPAPVAPKAVKRPAKKASSVKPVIPAEPVVPAAKPAPAAKPVEPVVQTPVVDRAADAPTTTAPAPATASLTTVICTVDIGFGNALYIRGEGKGLSWEQGVRMENVGPDEWRWSSNQVEGELQFKVLRNDTDWQTGNNHLVYAGATISFAPQF